MKILLHVKNVLKFVKLQLSENLQQFSPHNSSFHPFFLVFSLDPLRSIINVEIT